MKVVIEYTVDSASTKDLGTWAARNTIVQHLRASAPLSLSIPIRQPPHPRRFAAMFTKHARMQFTDVRFEDDR